MLVRREEAVVGPMLGVGERGQELFGLESSPTRRKARALPCVAGRGLHPGDVSPIPFSHSLEASLSSGSILTH